MNNIINLNVNELTNVKKYTITTKDGKSLTLTGELARNVSALDGLGKMTDKATLYKAIFITKIMHMNSPEFKEKYSVKDSTTFITKYLGYTKTTIDLYKNTIDMFFNDGELVYEELAEYNLAQLQELCKFVRTDMEKNGLDLDNAINDLCMICETEFPYTMSSKNMRKAIDKYFTTVEEPTNESAGNVTESAGNVTESAGNDTESAGNDTESAGNKPQAPTLDMMLTKCKTVLVRCQNAREMFDGDGHYTGDEMEAHFRDTLDFVIGLLTIENK